MIHGCNHKETVKAITHILNPFIYLLKTSFTSLSKIVFELIILTISLSFIKKTP